MSGGRAPALATFAAVVAAALGACGADPAAGIGERMAALPSPAAAGSTAPHLALAPDGAVVMSWLEPVAAGGHALRLASLRQGAWSAPVTVAQGTDWFINWADFPSVSPITATDWAAHWLVKQPGGTYSYDVAIAISRDAGATWSAPLTPHDDGTRTEHGFATLFPWGGDFGAVWLDGRNTRPDAGGGGMTVRYARIGFDGRIVAGGEIDDLACDCCATDVAVARDGPVATWRNRTREEIRDIVVSRFADGAWQPPQVLGSDNWKIPGCPVNGSTIAARGEQVVVAWYTAPGRQPRVQLAWSGDGGRSFSPPVLVADGAVSGRVDVALVAEDLAVVSWTSKPASGPGQWRLRVMPARGEPGPERLVTEGDVSRAGGFPQMIHAGDRLVFAWTVPGEPSRVMTAWAAAN